MITPPFFSIIITTYNRGHLLHTALDSLLAQTESDWEAIIVDDGSTDGTYSKIMSRVISDSRIKYLIKSHTGCALSKNEGVFASTGRFITFLDSDDEYDPDHLKSRKNILLNEPGVKFLHGGTTIIGNPFVPDRFDSGILIHLNDCEIGGTFFIERSTLVGLKGFRTIMLGEDADLFDRAKKSGIMIRKTMIPTYIYHHETEDSVTNNMLLIGQKLSMDFSSREISL